MESTPLLTLEDFMQRYSDEGPFEWINGVVIPVQPVVLGIAHIRGCLFRKLADFADIHGFGEVYGSCPFVLLDDQRYVKRSYRPDILFITSSHLREIMNRDPDWGNKPLIGPPDLVVEVVSPTDLMTHVNRKVRLYLEDGVQLVWVVEPDEKSVSIFTPNTKQFTRLTIEDTLSGGDILPNFALPLEQLFE